MLLPPVSPPVAAPAPYVLLLLPPRSHLPAPTVVNLQQAFKSAEDWVGVMVGEGRTDVSVDRHEYQVGAAPGEEVGVEVGAEAVE